VALNLVREQLGLGCRSELWSLDGASDLGWAAVSCGLPPEALRGFPVSTPSALRWSRQLERTARREAGRLSVVHQHALWTGLSHASLGLRRKHGIPVVIAPHGALEQWALAKSRWKKRIALALYERDNLFGASCLHACSDQELQGFREYGLSNPVAVIPNGVSRQWLESSGDGAAFRSRFKLPQDKRVLLFLSRITPVKGLTMLMEALAAQRSCLSDWLVVVAGADEGNHLRQVRESARRFAVEGFCRFTGPLFDQGKRDAFAAAELFVLPTLRENYGIVVAEALGAGLPVITTKGAPWSCLTARGCGWWTEVDPQALAAALGEALRLPPEALGRMGARGREIARTEHTWESAGCRSLELYRWLAGEGEMPPFVSIY
jgi:glycosyltransferase involved in cell wall biosynthesis